MTVDHIGVFSFTSKIASGLLHPSWGHRLTRLRFRFAALDCIVINDRLLQRPFRKEIPILRYHDIAGNATRLRALTSLMPDEFLALLPAFEAAFLERMRASTIDGLPRLNRRYAPYKNSPLPTIEDKLLFILVHIKQNVTQDVHGQLFGMLQSDANNWLQLLRPVLAEALQRLDVLPARLATAMEQSKMPTSDDPPFCIMMVPNDPFNDQ